MVFIVQIIANIVAILISVRLILTSDFTGSWVNLIIAGFIIGLVNYVLKIFLKAVWSSFIFVTLAVFTILINITLLTLTSIVLPGIAVASFLKAFWIIVIICLTNYGVGAIMHYE
jgi:uncharacterized membrane protein YvlD (DUF360 family)